MAPARIEVVLAPEGSGLPDTVVWRGTKREHGPPSDERVLKAMQWSRSGITDASHRCHVYRDDARLTWTAAVEGVWWVLALDEALDTHIEQDYCDARAVDEFGQVVRGMRWLRHRHAHEIFVTGAGGPKRPFFGGPEDDYVLFISPANRWKRSKDVYAPNDGSAHLRPRYDEHVAGWPLDESLNRCAQWFDRVFKACGFPCPVAPEDPTILD